VTHKYISTSFLAFFGFAAMGQDTIKDVILPVYPIQTIEIKDVYGRSSGNMPAIDGVRVQGGKKSNYVSVQAQNIDLSSNNSRQLFARIPGISIWESDGSGIQAGVATRGLSPNRSWEFNVRQNGYDISSDVFGYPEAYYTPPADALKRIEVLRGSAALQYGPQFGGLLNYVFDDAPVENGSETKVRETFGSYGLFNHFISTGFRKDKFSLYSFYHRRSADGWRDNSAYTTQTGFLKFGYAFNKAFKATLEITHSNFVSQQAGGLTDEQFSANAKQSFRERNWMSNPWNLGSLTLTFTPNEKWIMELKAFGMVAQRNSVGYLPSNGITVLDVVDTLTNEFAPRQVDKDDYTNWGAELRIRRDYLLFKRNQTIIAGARLYNGNTDRFQKGIGTTGHDYDMSMSNLGYKNVYDFNTQNAAIFSEMPIHIAKRFLFVPGIRYEFIHAKTSGIINYTTELPEQEKTRKRFLFGFGAEYHMNEKNEVYANASQAFRPVLFSELIPSSTTDIIDPNLKESSGLNVDFGVRGSVMRSVRYDFNVYQMSIDNRVGNYTENGVRYVTNIGASQSKGAEAYLELDVLRFGGLSNKKNGSGSALFNHIFGKKGILNPFTLQIFGSLAYNESEYTSWTDPNSANDRTGYVVENAPRRIQRFGANATWKDFTLTYQFNKVSECYSDALNTVTPTANGNNGLIPGYQVSDITLGYKGKQGGFVQAGVNNLFNEKYFTRRAGGYPGPGLLPANGRTLFFTVGFDIK
jgi:Fe(3+) dicitrate transport protein